MGSFEPINCHPSPLARPDPSHDSPLAEPNPGSTFRPPYRNVSPDLRPPTPIPVPVSPDLRPPAPITQPLDLTLAPGRAGISIARPAGRVTGPHPPPPHTSPHPSNRGWESGIPQPRPQGPTSNWARPGQTRQDQDLDRERPGQVGTGPGGNGPGWGNPVKYASKG